MMIVKCLICDEPITVERAREGKPCQTCEGCLGTMEEAAKSFAWAQAAFGGVDMVQLRRDILRHAEPSQHDHRTWGGNPYAHGIED
jgi:hypothetical protein